MHSTQRRDFLLRCGALLAGTACARAGAGAAPADTQLVYVGTQGRQIHALRFDPASGALAAIGTVADGPRPTWVGAHPRLPILYAVDDDNARPGRVIAYAADPASGALEAAGEAPAGGTGTTFFWVDQASSTILAANFASATVSSIALDKDALPATLVSTVSETGSGPHRRQASAHAHAVALDPSGRYALVPDLGADRVFIYGFDRATRALASGAPAFALPAGSGPRHLAWSRDGRFVYLVAELSAQVWVLRWDAGAARLAPVQSLAVSSPGFAGPPSASEIALSGDGRFVYIGNRGENLLQVYRTDPDSGELALVQQTACGGENPWSFVLHGSGRWLLAANQKSGGVSVFALDPASGRLRETGQTVAVPAPVSLALLA